MLRFRHPGRARGLLLTAGLLTAGAGLLLLQPGVPARSLPGPGMAVSYTTVLDREGPPPPAARAGVLLAAAGLGGVCAAGLVRRAP